MTTTDAPSDALLGFLFRSCVACYNAKPWQLLNDSDTVRLNVDAEPPILARFTGPDGDSSPGVLLVSAYTKEQELEAPEEPIAFSGARVFMLFVPEHEAPQWLRDARRVNKWPLASPSAFPAVFAATNDAGETRALSADEMRTLCVAINVLVTFVATKRKQTSRCKTYETPRWICRMRRRFSIGWCGASFATPARITRLRKRGGVKRWRVS